MMRCELEARGGIEPPMRVLQTHALPLGYRAVRCAEARYEASDCCERPHPLRDELHPHDIQTHPHDIRTVFGSSGKRHLGVLLAALPMNQAHTLWCAGAEGEVAAYRFRIELLNTSSTEGVQAGRPARGPSGLQPAFHPGPKSRKPASQSFWRRAATTLG